MDAASSAMGFDNESDLKRPATTSMRLLNHVDQASELERKRAKPRGQDKRRPRSLRIYLGYAPGVGKTVAMLQEGRRRQERGADVIVCAVNTYGRSRTQEALGGLEVASLRGIHGAGLPPNEMDVDFILNRHPQVALVDELAHENPAGFKNRWRYQDVDELLDAGIQVVTTMNIFDLEDVYRSCGYLAGAVSTPFVPDDVFSRANEVEIVDQTPDALRKRVMHGNVRPEVAPQVLLDGLYRKERLVRLREIVFLRMLDRCEKEACELSEDKLTQDIEHLKVLAGAGVRSLFKIRGR